MKKHTCAQSIVVHGLWSTHTQLSVTNPSYFVMLCAESFDHGIYCWHSQTDKIPVATKLGNTTPHNIFEPSKIDPNVLDGLVYFFLISEMWWI